MKNDDKALLSVIAATGLPVVGAALYYIHTARAERLKRKKIEAWQAENLACIANAQTRLVEVAENPASNLGDVIKAMTEEESFLRIIRNQPPY